MRIRSDGIDLVRVTALTAALATPAVLLDGAEKVTAEQLVTLHVKSVFASGTPATEGRDIRGACRTMTPARAAGQLAGTFSFASAANSSKFTLQFSSDLYEGETFAAEGDQVDIGFAQPRTSSRSAVGTFVARHRVMVGEGLFGGALNARWALLRVADRKPKLTYDGLKKLDGRDLHRLRYRAKDKQGDLEVALYFEPDTYRHVASVYTSSQAQGIGTTIESSSQESDMHFKMEERFSNFVTVGGMTLPKTWLIRYERSGNTSNEWRYDLTVQSINGATAPAGGSTP